MQGLAQPNTYEATSCQETHFPSERTVYFFSAFQRLVSRQSVDCSDLVAGLWLGQLLYQTRIEVLTSLGGRLPRTLGLGDLETYPYPPTGLFKEMAAWRPCTS